MNEIVVQTSSHGGPVILLTPSVTSDNASHHPISSISSRSAGKARIGRIHQINNVVNTTPVIASKKGAGTRGNAGMVTGFDQTTRASNAKRNAPIFMRRKNVKYCTSLFTSSFILLFNSRCKRQKNKNVALFCCQIPVR